ncbi:MAG TPA: hypothetical protein ENK02_08595 [Planctomycetes bacterium]|nr:hypothetical protein [Planctomycetota bacterium]
MDSPLSRRCFWICALPLFLLAACDRSGGSASGARVGGQGLRREQGSLQVEGQAALAASLLAADPRRVGEPWTKGPASLLGQEMGAMGESALRSLFLESGQGSSLLWSPWLQRKAEARKAPKDRNAKAGNLDEVLDALRLQYAFRTNARLPEGLAQGYLLPGRLLPRLASRPRGREDYGRLRLQALAEPSHELRPGQLGQSLLALSRAASLLLGRGRGDLYGRTPKEGMIGLLLLEKALATERLLLAQCAFDGKALSAISDPERFDPKLSPRIFPARLRWTVESPGAGLPPRPAGFVPVDRGAQLADLAALLRGAAALSWLADPRQPNPLLRRLFEGDPFGEPGIGGTSASSTNKTPPSQGAGLSSGVISWEKHTKGLIQGYCLSCHSPPGPNGGFSVTSYSNLLKGGNHQKTNPILVPKDHGKSLLWQILTPTPPKGFDRMPQFGPYLKPAEIQLIADWIDGGALEKDPGGREVRPRPGLDSLQVCLRMMAASFRDPTSGALVDRADLQGRGQAVFADSLGQALLALAEALEVRPEESLARTLLMRSMEFASRYLLGKDGEVFASFDLVAGKARAGEADLGPAARLLTGLLEASRVLRRSDLRARALRAAAALRARFLDQGGLRRSFATGEALRLDPGTAAGVLDFLAVEARVGTDPGAAQRYRDFFKQLKGMGLILAEWPEAGEAFGDGNPDSDGDGVPEVGSAGLPPLFAAAVVNGDFVAGRGLPQRPIHYSRDVLPLLLQKCGSCHAGGNRRGDFALDSFGDLFRGGAFRDRTRILVPGDPGASFFYQKVELRKPPFGVQMPLGFPPLGGSGRALLRSWIQGGARRD